MNGHGKTWRLLPPSLLIVLALALGLFANQPAFSAALSEIPTPSPTNEPDGSFACVDNWTGSGQNSAAVAIDWNDGKNQETLVWGYRWDGEATGEDMLTAIASADSRLFVYTEDSAYGTALKSIGYDLDDDGFTPGEDETCTPGDTDDHFCHGWMTNGYWSYWTSTDDALDTWTASMDGIGGRNLSDGDWDGLSFASAAGGWASDAPELPDACDVGGEEPTNTPTNTTEPTNTPTNTTEPTNTPTNTTEPTNTPTNTTEPTSTPTPNADDPFACVENWAGTGSNRAAVAIDWNDGKNPETFVWGYRWNGAATGEDMLTAVAQADSRLFIYTQGGSGYGVALMGVGYDLDNDGFTPGADESCAPGDADDHFCHGWMTNGFWSYWLGTGTDTDDWGFASTGMSGRTLSDGAWDGWSFASAASGWSSNAPELPAACTGEAEPTATPTNTPTNTPEPTPEHDPSMQERMDAASDGGAWILEQPPLEGSNSLGFAVDNILSIVAVGEDVPATYITYMQTHAETYAGKNPASAGKLALGVIAAGENPRNFGGVDLIAMLEGYYDSDTGRYVGPYNGTNWDQAFAILSLHAAGEPIPDAARTALATDAMDDGSWCFYESSSMFNFSCTDSTGLVLMALSAAGEPSDSTAIQNALTYLDTNQNSDAGWPDLPDFMGSSDVSNINSTAFVVMGLQSVGEDLYDDRWTQGNANVYSYMLSLQQDDGRFWWTEEQEGSALLSTQQSVPAIAGFPYTQVGGSTTLAATPSGTTRPAARPLSVQPASTSTTARYVTIAEAGGTFTEDGVSITVDGEAVPTGGLRMVYVANDENDDQSILRDFSLYTFMGNIEEVQHYAKPLTIVASYDDAALSADVAEASLTLATWNETTGTWDALPGTVDADTNQVTATATEGTRFALITGTPEGNTTLYLPVIAR